MSSIDTLSFTSDARRVLEDTNLMPLRVRGLGLQCGDTTILQDLDLDLAPQGCTAIMGPNGAGKSMLLKLLHGLIEPSTGDITWGGTVPSAVTARQAMVFQKPVLLRRSVAANVDFVLKTRRKSGTTRDALLAHVGLLHKARDPARRLSGGEAQRLALARALACEPEVLFLDEATASLDPASVKAIEDLILDASAKGIRIIFVTHDIGQAKRLADDVVFLQAGRVAEHSPARSFFSDPRSSAARDYLNGRLVF